MSLSCVGNAAIGIVAVDLLKYAFTSEASKPETKGDFKQFISKEERYQLIKDLILNIYGQLKYFFDL